MTHSEFISKLDGAILDGQSLSQIARSFAVNQTTVSRRKAALRAAGHRIPTQGNTPESLRQERRVNHDRNCPA
jgi:hypothetical protein